MKFNMVAKPMKKIVALLSIALLISLVGCSGSATVDNVPSSSNVESQPLSETPETPPEAIESTAPTQDPTQSENPAEATQEPTESKEPPEATIEPTKQPEQTSPPASSAPVSTPTPTPTSSPAPTQTHTHSYTSAVTKEATCNAEGILTYTCSCGDSYNEAIGKTDSHNWSIRHIDEVGHYENSGTHKVTYYTCDCGFSINSDDTNYIEIWKDHKNPITGCRLNYAYIVKDVPNSDSQYVIDTPAHDETYCTVCGAIQ